MIAFLPSCNDVIKLEFCSLINDNTYFYLLGSIKVTECEILKLIQHFEMVNDLSPFEVSKVKYDSSDEEYRENIAKPKGKKKKLPISQNWKLN